MYAVAYVHCIPRRGGDAGQRVQIIGHVSKGEEGIFMSIESGKGCFRSTEKSSGWADSQPGHKMIDTLLKVK